MALAAVLCLASSCSHSTPIPDSRPVQATGQAIERARVRNASASASVTAAKTEVTSKTPSVPATVAHLDTANRELTDQTHDLDDAKRALKDAQDERDQLVKRVQDEQAKYAKLENRWYVKAGRWITRMFWLITIGGVLLLILHAVLDFYGITALAWINPIKWVLWLCNRLWGPRGAA